MKEKQKIERIGIEDRKKNRNRRQNNRNRREKKEQEQRIEKKNRAKTN